MYRKAAKGWLKHWDFILWDMLCIQVAFVLAYFIRQGLSSPYGNPLYLNMAVFLGLADLVVLFFHETLKNVLKRGWYREFAVTVVHMVWLELLCTAYLFTVQNGQEYSRLILYLTGGIYLVLTYMVRVIWKHVLKKRMQGKGCRSLLIICKESEAPKVVRMIQSNNLQLFNLAGIVLTDCDRSGETIENIPVVATIDTTADYIRREWVDEVLLIQPSGEEYPQKLLSDLLQSGAVIHINLNHPLEDQGRQQIIEKIGDYTVLTSSMNCASSRQVFLKRSLDILGALVGCVLTLLIGICIAPIIYCQSPGSILFTQIRVGKNGRKFKMYKFRSMYLDAEERKQEYLKLNRVKDGMMFKLDFDPRVIGNRVLADGRRKTGIGQFIRDYSLDEFPQFFNVLKGEMSLVGTRPPTVDEWEKYELRHRARLATKPGITGLWQISGRSNITDFEEVVNLDVKYINEWSVGLDLRILASTVVAVVKKRGAA